MAALAAAKATASTHHGISDGVPGLSLEDKILLARLLGHVSCCQVVAVTCGGNCGGGSCIHILPTSSTLLVTAACGNMATQLDYGDWPVDVMANASDPPAHTPCCGAT